METQIAVDSGGSSLGDPPPSRGLITKPSIVKSALSKGLEEKRKHTSSTLEAITLSDKEEALRIKEKGKSKNGKTKPKSKNTKKTKKPDDSGGTSPNEAKESKDSKTLRSAPLSSPPTTPSPPDSAKRSKPKNHNKTKNSATPKKPNSDEEDLKKILYPDLFSGENNSSPMKNNNKPQNSTPIRAHKPKDPSLPQLSTSPGSLFAGSSFHHSPAPSALPKPSFKSKSVSSSAPTMSMFEKFMQADRDERQRTHQSPIRSPVRPVAPLDQQRSPILSPAMMSQQLHAIQQPAAFTQGILHPPPARPSVIPPAHFSYPPTPPHPSAAPQQQPAQFYQYPPPHPLIGLPQFQVSTHPVDAPTPSSILRGIPIAPHLPPPPFYVPNERVNGN